MRQGEVAAEQTARENPLVPNRVLRRLYALLLEHRALEETVVRGGGAATACGACLATLAVSLGRGDLVSEAGSGAGLGLLREASSGLGKAGAAGWTMLPAMAVATERLLMAVGAAVAVKAGAKGRVMVVLVEAGEMPAAMWRQMLGFVARLDLPVLFVVLPGAKAERSGALSAKSGGWGVPGFPVDSEDAVALYRVVQESLGRLRAGEGPVLLEGIRWRRERGAKDAVGRMEAQMRARGLRVGGAGES